MPALSQRRIRKGIFNGDRALTSHARGQTLEDVLIYIVGRIPGVRFLERDVRVSAGSEEIDLVFWNDRLPDGLPFLPHILMFECKNWATPVDSASVAFFIDKLRRRHLEYGFLIAANGITGNGADLTAAYRHVHDAFLVDHCGLIIFDRRELFELTSTEQFVRLIQHKISRLYLATP